MKLLTVLLLCAVAIGCGYGSSTPMQVAGTTPTINQQNGLSPSSMAENTGPFPLTVIGANFASSAFVTFNNQQMPTTWTNSGKVVAMIPNSAIQTSGMVNVIVTNPATKSGGIYGGGTAAASSQAAIFTITP